MQLNYVDMWNAGGQVRLSHRKSLLDYLRSLGVELTGSTHLTLKNGPKTVKSEADLLSLMEGAVYTAQSVSKTTPISYWRALIEEVISEEKASQLAHLIGSHLAYNAPDTKNRVHPGTAASSASPINEMAPPSPVQNPGQMRLQAPRLARFVDLLVESGSATNDEIAIMYHFIWQIKRKGLGLPVSYHVMPILCGPTGSGKSEAIRRLLSPIKGYVINGLSLDKIGDDRYYKQFNDHLVIFFDEMPRLDRANNESLKQIITADELTGRRLYSNSYASYVQRTTFIGASNATFSELIKDDTSMRRFYYMKSPKRLNWDEVNAANILLIWQEVNEQLAVPSWIIDNANSIARTQEQTRHRNALESFLEEGHVVTTDPAEVKAGTLEASRIYDEYVQYCKEGNYAFPLSKRAFNMQLTERFGFVRVEATEENAERTGVAVSYLKLYPRFYAKLATKNTQQHKILKLTKKGS